MSSANNMLAAFGAMEMALPDVHHHVTTMREPTREIAPVAPSDPARMGYPPTFPFEIALRTASVQTICEAYGIGRDEWEMIRFEPTFLSDLARAVEQLKEEGMSFKVKARLQAEELLKTSWRTIHDASTPPSVKADLIKATARWAGYDTPPSRGADGALVGSGHAPFQINIQFNNQRGG